MLHHAEAVLDPQLAGTLSELCWADVTGRMCCRLMRDLRYLDLSNNSVLAAAQAQGEDGQFVSGACSKSRISMSGFQFSNLLNAMEFPAAKVWIRFIKLGTPGSNC